ncbi:MAG TPA: HNH endonuclease [Acidimicrobiales bacterium]|nr:HNH endonuclease [Acidimicrobiales bacterium]
MAHRLEELKLVRTAFAAGELSYSKVRAISRVATAETEQTLVELARHATANHMEQIARAYRGLKRRMAKDGKGGEEKDGGYLYWHWDDDGYLVIVGRFPPAEGAIFIEALNAARAAQAGDAEDHQPPSGDSAESRTPPAEHGNAGDSAESRTQPPQRADPRDSAESLWAEEDDDYLNGYWMVPEDDESGELVWVASGENEDGDSAEAAPKAPHDDESNVPLTAASNDSAESHRVTAADALVSMAETMLRYGPQARDGGDRYQAVVIVDAKVLAGDEPGRCEIDNGPAISPELARQITCDSSVIMTILGAGGEPLNIGRTTRTIPMAIRRALRIRDGKCRFPGCSQRRYVDGHHIQHWSQGGETSLENLVLLCRLHHRKVHEDNFTVRYDGGTKFTFTRPDGAPIPEAPAAVPALPGHVVRANQALGLSIGPETGSSLWAGEQLDLAMVIDGLFALEDRNLN